MINNIRKLRKERGLTLKRLSELTGLAPSLISRYENGDRHPKIENWQKLADYFGVSVEYLQGKTFINKRPDKEKMAMNGSWVASNVVIYFTKKAKERKHD